MSLQELLDNIQNKFSFLFEKYNFTVKYTFERSHPVNIRIGLESDKLPNIKILFVHEWAVSVMIGSEATNFEGDSGWISVKRIVDFLKKHPMRWPPDKINISYSQFLLKDLDESAKELNENCEVIFGMFCGLEKNNHWEKDFKKYVTSEVRRRFTKPKE